MNRPRVCSSFDSLVEGLADSDRDVRSAAAALGKIGDVRGLLARVGDLKPLKDFFGKKNSRSPGVCDR